MQKVEMRIISVIDTSICSYNIGDQIIMEAVYEIINDIFKDDFVIKLQCIEKFGILSLKYIYNSDYTFLGGANVLTSQINKYKQIGFRFKDLLFIKQKIILLGVGWWQYQKRPNLYTRFFFNTILSKNFLHSVRDEYTKNMLNSIGIKNVLNTSCPSVWKLTKEHCNEIPHIKRKNVITTLTDYNKSPVDDEKLINLLLENYETIFYWVQGIGDLKYLNSLNIKNRSRIKIIPPKLSEYDRFCQDIDADYIGTRLHAGIRALQHKKRSLIIAIDNRAKEIAKDINLNIAERGDFAKVKKFINEKYVTDLNIPFKNIERWKSQFK